MKRIYIIIIAISMTIATSYSQDGYKTDSKGNEISIRFENRKKKGYYNITQISMLMGNRTTTRPVYFYYPHYLSSSSYAPSSSFYYPIMPVATIYDTEIKLQLSPSITTTHGYMFNKHWAAGIGVGFEIFNYNTFPIFADIRYTLWDNKISPFFAFKAGYSFNFSGTKHYDNKTLDHEPYYVYNADIKNSGGLMLHPEIGVTAPLSERYDIQFTVAYRYQVLKSEISNDYGSGYYDHWQHTDKLSKLSFGIAIMFR